MKRKRKILIVILIFILTVVCLKCLSNEDDWICEDGKWIMHGHPSSENPLETCEDTTFTERFKIPLFSAQLFFYQNI